MAITINDSKSQGGGNTVNKGITYEYKALSTDTKPTDCGNNSVLWELDTNKFYYFDRGAWMELGTPSTGTDDDDEGEENWEMVCSSQYARYQQYDNSISVNDDSLSYTPQLNDKFRVTIDGDARVYVLDYSPFDNSYATSNVQSLDASTDYAMYASRSGSGDTETQSYSVVHDFGWANGSTHEMIVERAV